MDGSRVILLRSWKASGKSRPDWAGLEATNRRLDEGLREVRTGLEATNRRVDRIFYAILAVGGALLVAIFANRIIGG